MYSLCPLLISFPLPSQIPLTRKFGLHLKIEPFSFPILSDSQFPAISFKHSPATGVFPHVRLLVSSCGGATYLASLPEPDPTPQESKTLLSAPSLHSNIQHIIFVLLHSLINTDCNSAIISFEVLHFNLFPSILNSVCRTQSLFLPTLQDSDMYNNHGCLYTSSILDSGTREGTYHPRVMPANN